MYRMTAVAAILASLAGCKKDDAGTNPTSGGSVLVPLAVGNLWVDSRKNYTTSGSVVRTLLARRGLFRSRLWQGP